MAAHFNAAFFLAWSLRSTRSHISLPLLPAIVLPPFARFGQYSASSLEHFALMKSCHVSSGYDRLKVQVQVLCKITGTA